MNLLCTLVLLVTFAFSSPGQACSGGDCAETLAYQAFGTAEKPKAIAVFLHGAISAGGAADYMYRPANRFAETHPDIIAIALLAPGYYDSNGKRSGGWDGGRRLSDDTDALIAALRALRTKYGTDKILALGHSKGGMNLGGILGKEPGLISGAVLVAGVYDLQALSHYRNRPQNGIQGLDLVGRIPKSTRVILVHGESDRDVPIQQSIAFDEKARANGVASSLVAISGAGHNFDRAMAMVALEHLGSLVD